MERRDQRSSYVQDLMEELAQLGRERFNGYIPLAMTSNVPREFYLASRNYAHGIRVHRDNAEDVILHTARHLLGVDCRNEWEAVYVIGLANTFSLIKQLLSGELDNEQRLALRRKAEEMLGMTIRLGNTATRGGIASFIPRFTRAKSDRLGRLREQMEQNVTDERLHARIILLAT